MAKEVLTKRQQLFIEAYLGEAFFNATEAARMVGLTHPNKQGPRMLVNVGIKSAIKARIEESAMTANEVLARLTAEARGSLADMMELDGYFPYLDLQKAKENGSINLIKKIKFRELGGVESIELYDAQAAKVHIGRFHKLFVDKVEHSNPDGTGLLQPLADSLNKAYGDAGSEDQSDST
jgi:phage terminase small subunit